MEGKFIRLHKRIWDVLLLCLGAGYLALYIIPSIAGAAETAGLLFFLIFGLLMIAAAVIFLLFNRGAFFRIEDDAVHARYHIFGRLDCRVDEIAFAYAQPATLTILLKNGKRYTVGGLGNPGALCAVLRRKIFSPETETPEKLRQELVDITFKRKQDIRRLILDFVLLFAGIFLTVFLTGARDLNEFTRQDQIIFIVMSALGVLLFIRILFVTVRSGRRYTAIEHLKYRLRSALIVSTPFPSADIRRVYTDTDASARLLVCALPGGQGVYYSIQAVDDPFTLETVYTSGVCKDTGGLPEDSAGDDDHYEYLDIHYDELMDITAYVQIAKTTDLD